LEVVARRRLAALGQQVEVEQIFLVGDFLENERPIRILPESVILVSWRGPVSFSQRCSQ
jgi:hypothetical protein